MPGLSTSALSRRLKRLRSEGIIEVDVSIASRKALGRPIQMFVLVTPGAGARLPCEIDPIGHCYMMR
ncbi:hypothetical protein [Bradyrhizobium sp. CCBAU 45384]|uniref:hypothetical protein n=1 Tax=Bradyrhizobium sp. CCBAU 45384 TaxID=858428 RepID=UPI002FDF2738